MNSKKKKTEKKAIKQNRTSPTLERNIVLNVLIPVLQRLPSSLIRRWRRRILRKLQHKASHHLLDIIHHGSLSEQLNTLSCLLSAESANLRLYPPPLILSHGGGSNSVLEEL